MSGSLRQDVVFAVRSLRRSPGFVVATCAILALGIGMAAAMYTVYKTVIIDRLPVTDQDRLVVMHPLDRRGTRLDPMRPFVHELARDSALFRGVAGVMHGGGSTQPFIYETPQGSTALNLVGASPTANYFNLLGMRAEHGRLFLPDEDQPGAAPVAVLSHAAFERYFGGDTAVLGRTLTTPYYQLRARIIGVTPPGFTYPAGADVWTPLKTDYQVDLIARLAPGKTIANAREGLMAVWRRSNPFASAANGGKAPPGFTIYGVEASSLADSVLNSTRPALIALTLAVALLLVIACVNVGNLMLVRLLAREREITLRHAIGASHGDVARLFLIESALLAALAGVLGCIVAAALFQILRVTSPPQLPRVDALSVARLPIGATTAIIFFVTMAFGLLPSLMGSRLRSFKLLRADARSGSERRSKRRGRQWLVMSQMALALVMLSGAGLLVRTLTRLQSIDLGYRPQHVSLLSFTGPQSDLPNNDRLFAVGRRLVQRLAATPGVVSAAPMQSGPFLGEQFFIMKMARGDAALTEWDRTPFFPWEWVSPDYFRTLGITIREGRGLLPSDDKAGANVVVVSDMLARQLFPKEDPIGKRIVAGTKDKAYTIVGVANDTHFRQLRKSSPVAYFSWEQMSPFWNGAVAVRTTQPLAAMIPSLRAAVRDADPNLIMFNEQTMDQLVDAPLAQPRLSALLLTAFSLVALLLSVIGLYGVMSTAVRQQTRDIGVRVALGASPVDVYRLILTEAAWVIGIGAVIGLVASALSGRVLAAQLFEVSPVDPASLGVAALVLLAIGIAAAALPARRASHVDPAIALRDE